MRIWNEQASTLWASISALAYKAVSLLATTMNIERRSTGFVPPITTQKPRNVPFDTSGEASKKLEDRQAWLASWYYAPGTGEGTRVLNIPRNLGNRLASLQSIAGVTQRPASTVTKPPPRSRTSIETIKSHEVKQPFWKTQKKPLRYSH